MTGYQEQLRAPRARRSARSLLVVVPPPAGPAAATQPATRSVVVATALAAFFLALTVYLFTMAPDLTWAHFSSDGPELITAAMTGGVPHPPGYPTYTLLSRAFGALPFGTVAWRFNLLSALAAAGAVGLVAAAALQDRRVTWSAALAAALSLGFAPLVWGQATVTEVYALNLLLVAAFVWAALGQKSPLLAGLLLGLSVTTHSTSLLLVPLALALVPRRRWHHLLGGFLLGLTPLLALPLLAAGDSPVVWGRPDTLGGWWWLVSGQLYHANLGSLAPADLLARASTWSWRLLVQFAVLGWLFVVAGVYASRRSGREVVWLLVTAALCVAVSLLYGTDDAVLYLLPALLLLTPLLAAGLSRLRLAALLLPLALLVVYLPALNQNGDYSIRTHGQALLEQSPAEAVLITPGDGSIFTLWYLQHVEGQRADVTLVDQNLLAFDWYRSRLAAQQPALAGLDRDDPAAFVAANAAERPVCFGRLSTEGVELACR